MADKARRPYLAMDLDDFRKPGTVQRAKEDSFVRMPSRYLATSLDRESEFEKPYYDGSPRKMHLDWPVWDWPSINPITFHPGDTPKGYPVVGGCPHCALAFDPITDCVEDWAEAHAMIYCSMQPGTDCPDCTMQITAIVGKILEIAPGTWSRRSETAVVLSSSDYTYDPKTGQTKVKQPPIPGTMSLKVKVDPLIEKHILVAEMVDGGGNYCMADLEVTCGCNCEDPPGGVFQIDTANSDDVTSGKTATVVVKGGCPEYVWSISGTGWSINPTGASELMSATITVNTSTCNKTTSVPLATVSVTDDCGTVVTHKIKHEGGGWEPIAGFSRDATCNLLVCAGTLGESCAGNGVSLERFHYGVGAGGAYDAKWSIIVVNSNQECREGSNGDHTLGGGSDCGADTILGTEYSTSALCDCSGSLSYWTCGADCS